jgi:hypothetical protein
VNFTVFTIEVREMPGVLKALYRAFVPDISATAAHEVGHAIVSSHVGLTVGKVELLHGGRAGCTTTFGYVNPEDELLVAVAGFVAEEMANGNSAAIGFNKIQYSQDLAMAKELVGDDITAINKAIAEVHAYLAKPEIQAYSKYLVNVLVKKEVVSGAMFKAPC